MSLDLHADTLPLVVDSEGVIRVSDTRVTLDTLIEFYGKGQTAEELARGFPSISLADIHAVIAYYLRHRHEVDAYLRDGERRAADIERQVRAQQGKQPTREELLSRLAGRNERR